MASFVRVAVSLAIAVTYLVAASSTQAASWYYCDNPPGYYPDVRSCNGPWRQVPTTPLPRPQPVAPKAMQGDDSPSFDCAAARQPDEKLICSDRDLSHADHEMAAAYRQYLDAAGPAAKQQITEDQRKWISQRRANCSGFLDQTVVPGAPAPRFTPEAIAARKIECLKRQEANRTQQLLQRIAALKNKSPPAKQAAQTSGIGGASNESKQAAEATAPIISAEKPVALMAPGPSHSISPDRQGSDPSSCPAWRSIEPLKPITCAVIYPATSPPVAWAISGQVPLEAFALTNADVVVQTFVANVNSLMDRYNGGWRPSNAEIAEHAQQGYSASTLLIKLHVPENSLDTDKQAINRRFLDDAGAAVKFIDTTTEDAQTAAAERAGEPAYYLVALATLNDNGRLRRVSGFTPVGHIRPPQAREGCEKQAEIAAKQHLLSSANPYVSIQYECWTEAKEMAAIVALARCNQFGVGCDQLPF